MGRRGKGKKQRQMGQVHGDGSSLTTGYTHCISSWKKAPVPQFDEQPYARKTCLPNKIVYGVNHQNFFKDHLIIGRSSHEATVFSKVTGFL